MKLQPVVSIYPGFLNLRLYDRLFRDEAIELDLERPYRCGKSYGYS